MFCSIEPDAKHPDRWKQNPVFLCKTADRRIGKDGSKRKTFKEVLVEVIEVKNSLIQGARLTLIHP